jgi:ribosomal protein L15E
LTVSPARLAAYRTAQYRAAGSIFRIGRPSRELDSLLLGLRARQAVLITACNPRSRRTPAALNERAMARLHAALHRRPVTPAESGDGDWREAQFLALCPPAWAAVLARRFRQNAIVILQPGRAPRLRVLV